MAGFIGFTFTTGIVIGLVIGWAFLPEPAFVRRFFERKGLAKPTTPVAPTTPTAPTPPKA